MKRLFLLFATVFSFLTISCSKKGPEIELKQMELSELSPRIQWALVTNPYVACFEEASYEAKTVASFRKGEIYEVKGNCTVKIGEEKDEKKETWYALQNGWVPGSAIKIYSNKLRAEEAFKSLK